MDYHDPERGRAVATRAREFMDEEVIPVERALLERQETISESQLSDLHARAREYEVFGPGLPEEHGGLGLDFRERVPVIEESGRSLLGKLAMWAESIDVVHVELIQEHGSESVREQWVPRMCSGESVSAILMTEPMPGGGSDPTTTRTTATKAGDEWVLSGHKTWVTRGSDSDLLFVFARSAPDTHAHRGMSCFLVPMDAEGVELRRDVPHMGGGTLGEQHSEILFHDVRLPEDHLIGPEGEGFQVFQQGIDKIRAWQGFHKVGMAERSLQIAKAYMVERELFGETLAEKQAPRFDIATAETKLHVWRTLNRSLAERVVRGENPRVATAMHMFWCANVAQEIIDTCLQVLGANGMSKDLPVSNFYETVRGFRIYDGADEVHQHVIARDAFAEVERWHADPVTRYDESV